MEIMDLPFFSNSLRVTYTDGGVTKIEFRKKKASAPIKSKKTAAPIKTAIEKFLTGQATELALPVDWKNLEGTEFQKKVWKTMSKIPYGQTKTYGEIAKALKSPGAARAVGTACAKNPVLLAIPCHRVVGANGLGGFSGGGLSVKQRLLNLEKKVPSTFLEEKA